MFPNHDTQTLSQRECEACCYRRAHDPYAHGRVDNFYLRSHLKAVAEDRQNPARLRLEACKRLTHPSYPPETRASAAAAIVRLTDAAEWQRADA